MHHFRSTMLKIFLKVQKRVAEDANISCQDRLRVLGLTTLESGMCESCRILQDTAGYCETWNPQDTTRHKAEMFKQHFI